MCNNEVYTPKLIYNSIQIMFTSSSIIDNLNQSEGLEYKKLCRLLKVTKKSDKDKLDIALTALEKLEIIN